MMISIPSAIPVIGIVLITFFTTLGLSAFPYIILGKWLQRRKDPIDRDNVAKAKRAQDRAERQHEALKGRILFLYNIALEFLNQLIRFMQKSGIDPMEEKDV